MIALGGLPALIAIALILMPSASILREERVRTAAAGFPRFHRLMEVYVQASGKIQALSIEETREQKRLEAAGRMYGPVKRPDKRARRQIRSFTRKD